MSWDTKNIYKESYRYEFVTNGPCYNQSGTLTHPKIHCSNNLIIISSGAKSEVCKTSKILRSGLVATKLQRFP